jgi:hypothetical protein
MLNPKSFRLAGSAEDGSASSGKSEIRNYFAKRFVLSAWGRIRLPYFI